MTCPNAAAFDPQRKIRGETDRLICAARVGYVTVALDRGPFRGHATVVEGRLANELDLNTAFEARNRSHQQVVGVLVGRRPGVRCDPVLVITGTDREGVANDNPTRRRLPSRHQDVGARLIDPF